jgi:chromate reductase
MPTTPKILALAGSVRNDSFNKLLLRIAAAGATDAGGAVTLVDLKEYPLPLFDQDLESESGVPANGQALQKLFVEHQALLIASPEYNSTITPLLKNTIDWVSRPSPAAAGLAAFKGKIATLVSASPGALGGLRGLVTVRAMLGNIGVTVLPEQIAVPKANEAFNPDGSLKDAKLQASVQGLGKGLVEFVRKVNG